MPNNTPSTAGRRPFPWRCPNCREKDVHGVVIAHTTQVKHDGRLYDVYVPELDAAKCRSCGELLFDDSAGEQIAGALRKQLRLLTAEQIRSSIEALGMTQKELATRVGIAEATLSRWCTGAFIQSRAMDNYLRGYFAVPELRHVLVGTVQDPELGTKVVPGEIAKRAAKDSGNPGQDLRRLREDPPRWRDQNARYQTAQGIIRETGSTWGSRGVA